MSKKQIPDYLPAKFELITHYPNGTKEREEIAPGMYTDTIFAHLTESECCCIVYGSKSNIERQIDYLYYMLCYQIPQWQRPMICREYGIDPGKLSEIAAATREYLNDPDTYADQIAAADPGSGS